jgi:hypothetical protein
MEQSLVKIKNFTAPQQYKVPKTIWIKNPPVNERYPFLSSSLLYSSY